MSAARRDPRFAAPEWGLRLVGLLTVVASTLVRLRLAGTPLDRDEGEYAYMGQLILRGDVPYVAAHNMKLPGTYYAYAGILAAFGETDVAIRVALVLLSVATTALVYLLGRRLGGERVGVAAAATFAALSVGPEVLGFTANAEHFVLLPAVAAMLVLAPPTPLTTARVAGAGVLAGLAFVMKQPAAAFLLFGAGACLTARAGHRLRFATVFATASIVPYLAVCALMLQLGAFGPFWFWTVTYAREYVSMIPLATGVAELARVGGRILASAPGLWALAALGLLAMGIDRRWHPARGFMALLIACSALAVCPGLRFTEHYFLLLLPATALLAGVGLDSIAGRSRRFGVAAVLLATAIGQAAWAERAVFVELPPDAVTRTVYGRNPFAEARALARRLAETTEPTARVAVVGSEPEIYFYARRPAATTFIYMYPLMEPHPFATTMQAEMIQQLESAHPDVLVLVNVDTSWSLRPDSSRAIFEWATRTVDTDYTPVGTIEIGDDGTSVARWGDDAAAPPKTHAHLVVFRRRS